MQLNSKLRQRAARLPGIGGLVLGILTVAVLATGCVNTIPCQTNLRLNIPAEQKQTDELTIRMTEELRHLDVVVKPFTLGDSYKFQIGKSLEGNLATALQDLFRTTRVSSLPINNLTNSAFVLEAELVSYDLKIGASILSSHTAKLVIRYSFYQAGRPMFTLETKTDGSSAMSSGEVTGAIIIGLVVNAGGSAPFYEHSIGRAYDEALAKSVNELVGKILTVVPKK